MNEAELRKLLTQRETEGVEFKPGLLSRKEIAEYSVGIGNAGGGVLIMGVSDKSPRQILPFNVTPSDLEQIRGSVADSAHIRIELEIVTTSEGNVLVAKIPGRPRGTIYHTTSGKYLIRLDDKLRGMTQAEIDGIRREAGQEFTANQLNEHWSKLISPAAMEELRKLMRETAAENDLVELGDEDLLKALGLLDTQGHLHMAGLLLVGQSESLRSLVPNARWQFFRMLSDTDYDVQDSGHDCVVIALKRLRDLMVPNNPVKTIKGVLHHPEFPRYPNLALREILVNAFSHRDYETPGSVVLKLYPQYLEVGNPGGFVGGITPENILHHASTPRNVALFNALSRFKLANAANLGVPRIFRELLQEGKEPPAYTLTGSTVTVSIRGQEVNEAFLQFIENNPGLDVDHLLVIHYLKHAREITTAKTAEICQRPSVRAKDLLEYLTVDRRILEAGGHGKGQYYRLQRSIYEQLGEAMAYEVDKRLPEENAKARVLSTLQDRPLSNADLREITQFDRARAWRLMRSLEKENLVEKKGDRKTAKWHLKSK